MGVLTIGSAWAVAVVVIEIADRCRVMPKDGVGNKMSAGLRIEAELMNWG